MSTPSSGLAATALEADIVSGMEAQLVALYEERERLESELGFSSAEEIIAAVRSMEAQLNDLYRSLDSAHA